MPKPLVKQVARRIAQDTAEDMIEAIEWFRTVLIDGKSNHWQCRRQQLFSLQCSSGKLLEHHAGSSRTFGSGRLPMGFTWTRNWSREFGGDQLSEFVKVNSDDDESHGSRKTFTSST